MERIKDIGKFVGIFTIDELTEPNVITTVGESILMANNIVNGHTNILGALEYINGSSMLPINPSLITGSISTFYNIVLGSDVGNGTNSNPESANKNMTSATQSVVYSIPQSMITISSSGSSVIMEATLQGSVVLPIGTTPNHHIYTSATLRTEDGRTIAYKRFGIRTLTNATGIYVKWEIKLT